MIAFNGADSDPAQPTVPNVQDIPKEFDIFYKSVADFLPPGKTFKDLTPEEAYILVNQYRFSPFFPGIYQAITGFKDSMQ